MHLFFSSSEIKVGKTKSNHYKAYHALDAIILPAFVTQETDVI